MQKSLLLAALCGAAALNVYAAGVLPLDGDWKRAYAHGVSGMATEGKAVTGFNFLANPGKHPMFAADRVLPAPVNGDFTAETVLKYDLKDADFIGNAQLQLVDNKNRVIAQCGLRDHWIGGSAIIWAQMGKTQIGSRTALPHKGALDIRIDRAGSRSTIYVNSVKVMENNILTSPVTKIRLFYDTYVGGKGHFGTVEFSDPVIGALKKETPTAGAKTFVDTPRRNFAPEWVCSISSGFKKILIEPSADALNINGFENITPGAKRCSYVIDRALGEIRGDFTASLDMAWETPSNGMGDVILQLYNAKGTLVAETGVHDGWLTGSSRVAGWVGPGRKGSAFWLPNQGDESFIITRKGNRITIHCGHWKIDDQPVAANEVVTSARLVINHHLYYDKDNTTLLSAFGKFRIKRIAVTDKALPIPAPKVKPVKRPAKWEIGKPIVTFWAGPPMSEKMAAQLSEGGWNMAWGVSVADLDIMHKYGIRGIMWVTVPVSNDVNKQRLKWWLDSFRNHPAAYAVHCGDEPGGAKMDACARGVDFFIEAAPELMHYNNMFPINASNKQLGHQGTAVNAYKAHIEEYFRKLKPQLLSYDKYHFCFDGDEGSYFINQALIRQAALKYNVPSMNILQGCSWAPTLRVPTGDEYRYLVYTSMAYGSQGISNYVYGHPGHWGSVLDPSTGKTTALYDALKSINREFVAIASELQQVKSLAAWHAGEIPFGVDAMPENSAFQLEPKLENYSQGFDDAAVHYAQGNNFFNRKPGVKGFLVGCFGRNNRATHILVVNLDYHKSAVTGFKAPGEMELFDQKNKTWTRLSGKEVKLNIEPGSGALLRMVDKKGFALLQGNAARAVVKVSAPRQNDAKTSTASFYREDFTDGQTPSKWNSDYRKNCSGIVMEPSKQGLIIRGLKDPANANAEAILARSFPPVEGNFICRIEYDLLPGVPAAANNVEFKLQVPNGETLIGCALGGNNTVFSRVGWNGKIISGGRPQGIALKHIAEKSFTITRRGDVYTVSAGKRHGMLTCTGDTSPIAVLSIVLKGSNSSIILKNIEIKKLDL